MSLRLEEAFANAAIHLRAGRTMEAIGLLHQILHRHALAPEIWCIMAWIYDREDRLEAGLRCFQRALAVDPSHALARTGRRGLLDRKTWEAIAAEAAGDHDRAAALYGRILLAEPGHSPAAQGLARIEGARFGAQQRRSAGGESGRFTHFAAREALRWGVGWLQSGELRRAAAQFDAVSRLGVAEFVEPAQLALQAVGRALASEAERQANAAKIADERGRGDTASILRLWASALVEPDTSGPWTADVDPAETSPSAAAREPRASSARSLPGIGTVTSEVRGPLHRIRLRDRAPHGVVLLCHYPDLILREADDPDLAVHSYWEAREVARAFLELGYDVDAVPMGSPELPPDPPAYAAMFSLHGGCVKILGGLPASATKILLLTGSAPDYQNRRERERIDDLKRRRGVDVAPKRVMDEAMERQALERCDRAILLGNRHTLSTYDARWHGKIELLAPTMSVLPPGCAPTLRTEARRSFLWHGGYGAVLKGLDRVLDVCVRRADRSLDIVGLPASEPDFDAAFEAELYRTPSIRYHGSMLTSSPVFRSATDRCFAFVAPAASEATSVAAVTCLALGLYPIVSRDTGLDLPSGVGIALETCSLDEIDAAMAHVLSLPAEEVLRQSQVCFDLAYRTYARPRYASELRRLLGAWLS